MGFDKFLYNLGFDDIEMPSVYLEYPDGDFREVIIKDLYTVNIKGKNYTIFEYFDNDILSFCLLKKQGHTYYHKLFDNESQAAKIYKDIQKQKKSLNFKRSPQNILSYYISILNTDKMNNKIDINIYEEHSTRRYFIDDYTATILNFSKKYMYKSKKGTYIDISEKTLEELIESNLYNIKIHRINPRIVVNDITIYESETKDGYKYYISKKDANKYVFNNDYFKDKYYELDIIGLRKFTSNPSFNPNYVTEKIIKIKKKNIIAYSLEDIILLDYKDAKNLKICKKNCKKKKIYVSSENLSKDTRVQVIFKNIFKTIPDKITIFEREHESYVKKEIAVLLGFVDINYPLDEYLLDVEDKFLLNKIKKYIKIEFKNLNRKELPSLTSKIQYVTNNLDIKEALNNTKYSSKEDNIANLIIYGKINKEELETLIISGTIDYNELIKILNERKNYKRL